MASGFEDRAEVGNLAQRIYDTSTECLMAHSIRAVEKYLRDIYSFDTQIVLQPCEHVYADMGRLSWSSVAKNKGHITYIRFWDNKDLDKNHKRFCIAHELYHIVWSVGSSSDVPRDRKTESICDTFANDLCFLHDKFYEAQAKINNGEIRFHGLPFRSV
jgi:hypothetical protein